MKKSLLILISLISLLFCTESKNFNKIDFKVDYHDGEKILVGKVNSLDILTEIPDWKKLYESYTPADSTIEGFRAIRNDYHIVIILGIWCEDSEAGVPQFLKTLDIADNPHLKSDIYAVNRELFEPHMMADRLNVTAVPTFVIFSGEQEIGRMIEFPDISFESDFLAIISRYDSEIN